MRPNFDDPSRVLLESPAEIKTAWEVLVASRTANEPDYKRDPWEKVDRSSDFRSLNPNSSRWLLEKMRQISRKELVVAPEVGERVLKMLEEYDEAWRSYISTKYGAGNQFLGSEIPD